MRIRRATKSDEKAWAVLRAELWPELSLDEHIGEIAEFILESERPSAGFVAQRGDEPICAFAEVAIRSEPINGCESGRVGFLEGIFVRSDNRNLGVARSLLQACENWAREQGSSEFASDVEIENSESQAFHKSTGFVETERVIFFRKEL